MNDEIKKQRYAVKGEWLQIPAPTIPEEILFRWLAEQFSFPEKLWKKLNASGGIDISKRRLSLRLFPIETQTLEADWQPLDIVYEDDFVLVVNKEAGSKVHPTELGESGTLAHRIAGHYLVTGQQRSVRIVHRLDQQTSGLILFAKNEFAQIRLDEQMRERRIERLYTALVHGMVNTKSGTIRAAIGRDRHRDRYRVNEKGGQHAVSHFRTMQSSAKVSLLELRLETGRTHQIRVHLSSLGHPLLGDVLYGGDKANIERQALHAHRLTFPHPWTGEMVICESDLPADLRILMQKMM